MAKENISDPLLNKEKHKNKRNMAWSSFAMIIILVFFMLLYIPAEDVESYDNIITSALYTFSAVIIGYMGTSTWDSVNYQKNRKKKYKGSYDDVDGNLYEEEGYE